MEEGLLVLFKKTDDLAKPEPSPDFENQNTEKVPEFYSQMTGSINFNRDVNEDILLLQSIFENSQDGLMLATVDGIILGANPAACNMLGYSRAEFLKLSRADIVEVSDSRFKVFLEKRAKEGYAFSELILKRKNGTKFPVEITSHIFYNTNGEARANLMFRDISERKHAEQLIHERGEQFSKVFKYAPIALSISNLRDGVFVEVNDRFLEITGYSRDDVIGHDLFQVLGINPAESNIWLEKIALDNVYRYFEAAITKKDGEKLFIISSISKETINDKGFILTSFYDITELNKAKVALQQSEEKFSSIFYNSPAMITITNASDGTIVEANEVWLKTTGYIRTEAIGHTSSELGVFDNNVREETYRQVKEFGFVDNLEAKIRTKSGKYRNALVSFRLLTIAGQSYFLGMGLDITERKKLEEALQNEKDRLDITLRSIGDGVIVINREGKIELFNRAAENMTDWLQEEVLWKPLDKVIQIVNSRTGEHLESLILQQLISGGNIQQESEHYLLVARNGTTHYISYQGAPLLDTDGNFLGTVLAFLDITDKKKLTEERLKARNLESLGVLAGGIAHNFNNILTAILGNISLAMLESDETSPNLQFLEEAEKASLRAKDIAQQLITFAKGGSPLKQPTRIQDVIKGTVQFMLENSNLNAEFELSDNTWNTIADQRQISQVIQNLVQNAIDAMPNGGVLYVSTANITLEAEQVPLLNPGNYILITIRDCGSGIPADNIPMIFDPYFSTKFMGNGLGLSICYSIMRKHEGQIVLESEKGKGTTVSLYLPAYIEPSTGKPSAWSTATTRLGRILVVDEDESTRIIISKVLTKIGYTVETVETRKAALQAIQTEQPFNVIIFELGESEHSKATDFIEIIHQLDRNIKALGATDYITDPIMTYYREYGFDGAICKPFTPSLLKQALHEVLNP
ncbi:PAS domain S-box protein [Candidatus Chlorohelix sp.]|uniref:hybrid sensor histidine kinase/response regulator n=1 Tax=Candidatus Chlorohelix sp. TaxID=3139201 RepID=UPI0030481FDE